MSLDATRTDLLRRTWLFSELDESDLTHIAGLSRERACRAGEILVRQNDASGELFAVIQGRLRVTSITPEGDEVMLSVVGPSDVFGELALLDDLPRSATVTAAEHCRLLVVPRASFRPLLVRMPSLGLRLLQVMAAHVRRLSRRAEDAATLDVRTRLAKTLVEFAERFGMPALRGAIRITMRFSQGELGRMIFATREMTNKCLGELRRKRIVRHENGVVTVLKPNALRDLVEEAGARRLRSAGSKAGSKKRRRNGTVKSVPDRR
jgi:CRP-like cAMP-binding protein